MNIKAFACLFIFIAFGSCQGVSAWKPKMTPSVEEIIIQEGESIDLSCKGEGEIRFSTENLTANPYNVSYDSNTGSYNFNLPNATRMDTGWYACAAKNITFKNDLQVIDHTSEDISWIYVYVNSTEPFAVTTKSLGTHLSPAYIGRKVVIPCRTTSPNLNVIILYNNKPVPHEWKRVSKHSKIGFVIDPVEVQDSERDWTCKINGSDAKKSRLAYRYCAEDSRSLTKPIIAEDGLRHVKSGTNFTLYCNITVLSKCTNVIINWLTPKSVPRNRWIEGRLDIFVEKETVYQKKLTIINVEKKYAGKYTCQGIRNKIDIVSKPCDVIVWDRNETHPNASLAKDGRVELSENETAVWEIKIFTYTRATWKWFKGEKEIGDIGDSDTSKHYHTDSLDGTEHVFGISNVRLEDSGDYTVYVFTSKTTQLNESVVNITLHLTVNATPVAEIHEPLPYYAPGQISSFTCNSTGFPIPNVTWSFVNWPFDENNEIEFPTNLYNESIKTNTFSTVSQLTIPINVTGNLTCKVCNTNCTKDTKTILVSDTGGIFHIVDQGLITEGDNVTLTCAASVFNYTDEVEWKLKDSEELLESSSARYEISKVNTSYTTQSVLRFRNVRKTDSGNYSCQVKSKDDLSDVINYQLWVHDELAPIINKTNMNESKVLVDRKNLKTGKLVLECYAYGMPVPQLIWRRDNVTITSNDLYVLKDNNSTLHINFFHDIDSGRYSCNATNRLGSDEKHVDIEIQGKPENIILVSLICFLVVVIIIVTTYMAIRVHRERLLRKELLDAGLTHFEEGALECLNPDLAIDDQAELLPYDKKWEFPRERLKLGKQLGSGAFGVVMKAEARGICEEGEVTTVAVKMVRRTAEPSYMKALSSELKIMIHLGRHLNVVNLLGACTKTILTKRELFVIVEYCRFGNLHNYLQRHRDSFIDQIDPTTKKIDYNIGKENLTRTDCTDNQNSSKFPKLSSSHSFSVESTGSTSDSALVGYRQGTDFVGINMSPDGGVLTNNSAQPGWRSNYRGDYKEQNLKPICTQDLLCWAWQVSRGMEYLSSRNVLHGDLAARNILLADDNIVKICDFGLAKNMYKDNNYKKKGDGPLPIKWMAIESIRDRIFSTQSDVWSFGIVLWEFFTLARTPYPGMEAEKQLDRLIEGYRMEKPEFATNEIYDFMLQCWKSTPSLRPTFPMLVEKLGVLLTENVKTHLMDLNTPYLLMNTLALANGQSDYLTMSSPNHDYQNSFNPTLQVGSDTKYLPMSSAMKTNESDIFSPRSDLVESYFEFPVPDESIPIDGNPEDRFEAVVTVEVERPGENPANAQQKRLESHRQDEEQSSIDTEPAYHNIPNNNDLDNSVNSSADRMNEGSHKNLNEIILQKNNAKDLLSPSAISRQNDYFKLPKKKIDPLENVADSFNNPSYVILSHLEDKA